VFDALKDDIDADNIIAEDKNNNLMSSEGMEATEEEMLDSFADEDAIVDEGADSNFSI
jgi:translation initiation factor eIF-2B subunit gamma